MISHVPVPPLEHPAVDRLDRTYRFADITLEDPQDPGVPTAPQPRVARAAAEDQLGRTGRVAL